MVEFLISGLRSGIRGRSFHAVFLLGLLTIATAFLSGNFSPRQPCTVAMDVGFSGVRLSLVLLNLFWIQELVTREIDRRTILLSLAYPTPRSSFIGGRFAAVLVLSLLASIVLGLLLTVAVVFAGGGYEQEFPPSLGLPFWITIFGLFVDALVVAAFALCLSTVSTVLILPLVLGAAFAVAGKALGPTLEYLSSGASGDANLVERFGPIVNLVRWLLPDLSRLDWRDWPMYSIAPPAADVFWSVLMAICYLLILFLVSIILFARREFA